jgi:hypothetical protein
MFDRHGTPVVLTVLSHEWPRARHGFTACFLRRDFDAAGVEASDAPRTSHAENRSYFDETSGTTE